MMTAKPRHCAYVTPHNPSVKPMAIPAAVGDIYLASLVGQLDNQLVINTLTYLLSGIGGAPSTDDICNDMDMFFNTAIGMSSPYTRFLTTQPTEYVLNQVWIQCISPTRVRKMVYTKNLAGLSLVSGKWANSAQVITRRGDLATRSNVGSMHLVLPSQDPGSNGEISGGALTRLSAMAAWMTTSPTFPSGNGTVEPVLYHRNKTPNFTLITQAIPQLTVRTMHRRTVGLGK